MVKEKARTSFPSREITFAIRGNFRAVCIKYFRIASRPQKFNFCFSSSHTITQFNHRSIYSCHWNRCSLEWHQPKNKSLISPGHARIIYYNDVFIFKRKEILFHFFLHIHKVDNSMRIRVVCTLVSGVLSFLSRVAKAPRDESKEREPLRFQRHFFPSTVTKC